MYFNDLLIIDIIKVPKKELDKKIITNNDAKLLDDISDYRKCHCLSNKKYKNCCQKDDIIGFQDGDIFYCDITKYKSSKAYELNSKKKIKKEDEEVNKITEKVKQIFI